MKTSIKFLAVVALFFTFSFAANAQRGGGGGERGERPGTPEQMAEKQTTQMAERLSLDEAQTLKVQEINLTYAERMQEAQEENKNNREAMKVISSAIESEKSADLQLILTEEQFKTYQDMQTREAKPRGGRGGRRG